MEEVLNGETQQTDWDQFSWKLDWNGVLIILGAAIVVLTVMN